MLMQMQISADLRNRCGNTDRRVTCGTLTVARRLAPGSDQQDDGISSDDNRSADTGRSDRCFRTPRGDRGRDGRQRHYRGGAARQLDPIARPAPDAAGCRLSPGGGAHAAARPHAGVAARRGGGRPGDPGAADDVRARQAARVAGACAFRAHGALVSVCRRADDGGGSHGQLEPAGWPALRRQPDGDSHRARVRPLSDRPASRLADQPAVLHPDAGGPVRHPGRVYHHGMRRRATAGICWPSARPDRSRGWCWRCRSCGWA